jgi:hypothetical protein
VVDSGKYEFEVGYNSTTPWGGGSAADSTTAQLKRGFGKFDLGLELPNSLTSPAGIGDAGIHFKYVLLEQGEDSGLTLRADIKLSNGDAGSGLGSGYNNYAAMLIYSKPFGDFRTHYNLGYTLVGVPSSASSADLVNLSAAVEKEVQKGIDLVAEYYGVSRVSTGNVQIGGRWRVNDAIRFDAGYSIATNDVSQNTLTAGCTANY